MITQSIETFLLIPTSPKHLSSSRHMIASCMSAVALSSLAGKSSPFLLPSFSSSWFAAHLHISQTSTHKSNKSNNNNTIEQRPNEGGSIEEGNPLVMGVVVGAGLVAGWMSQS